MADWKPNPQLEKVERDRLCAVRSTLISSAYAAIQSDKPKGPERWTLEQFTSMSHLLSGIRDITETLKADTESLYLDPSIPNGAPATTLDEE